jgi:hypothetical protein
MNVRFCLNVSHKEMLGFVYHLHHGRPLSNKLNRLKTKHHTALTWEDTAPCTGPSELGSCRPWWCRGPSGTFTLKGVHEFAEEQRGRFWRTELVWQVW